MKPYEFTLALKNVNEETLHLEDSLYESGCDDALIHFRNGAVYLEFCREASTLDEAVISAIQDVRSASIDMDVVSVQPVNLVTESEMAKRLSVSRQVVSLWIKGERRKRFPHPVMKISEKSSLWNWSQVTEWLFENNIIKDKMVVEHAVFLANINGALEEQDQQTRKIRHELLARISL